MHVINIFSHVTSDNCVRALACVFVCVCLQIVVNPKGTLNHTIHGKYQIDWTEYVKNSVIRFKLTFCKIIFPFEIEQSSRTIPRNQNVSDMLVVIGGAPRYKCDSASDDVMAYNLTSKTWKSVATLPEPRHHHASKFLLYSIKLQI